MEQKNNPYLDGRREWLERYGSYISSAQNWKLVAFISMGIAILAIGGVIYIGAQSKIVPYVVEVDKLGASVGMGPVAPAKTHDERVVKYTLAEWVVNFRSICGDAIVQKDVSLKVYRHLLEGTPAYASVSDYYQKNSPFKRMEIERVSVEVISVIAISENTWQIDWAEKKFDTRGNLIATENYRGAAMLRFIEPKTEADIYSNPAGLWVYEFSWQKILK